MSKQIIWALSLVVVLILIGFAIPKFLLSPDTLLNGEGNFSRKEEKIKDEVWGVWQAFLQASKENDFEKAKQFSFVQSDECLSDPQGEACKARMQNIYEVGDEIQKDTFSVMWYDDKQVILSTPYYEKDNGTWVSLAADMIYFIKQDDKYLLLAFRPYVGWEYGLMENQTAAEGLDFLRSLSIDTDKDGFTDQQEGCNEGGNEIPDCTKTDPTNRDTNNNGWWDGIEIFVLK